MSNIPSIQELYDALDQPTKDILDSWDSLAIDDLDPIALDRFINATPEEELEDLKRLEFNLKELIATGVFDEVSR